MKNIACIGAGFSGAVIARELALAGNKVSIFDIRDHVAGNCHTERDRDTGVMLHVYGPHIFHTSNLDVWNYINQFDEFMPFINRVKAVYNERVYPLPINLLTLNTFFKKAFSPAQAQAFVETIRRKDLVEPSNLEEQALAFIGKDLYEAFIRGYTTKQWGRKPSDLPASIIKRLPVRFNYDDNYYPSFFQGIPKNGYTYIVEKIVNHPNINLNLNTKFSRAQSAEYDHVFYSGPIDAWFNDVEGSLAYRTLDFKVERHKGDYQGNAVINYSNEEVPWTRISEHKHFSPWESHENTVIYKEFSRECSNSDIPYYPIRLANDKLHLSRYVALAEQERNVTFVGRLGTYRYLDMHVTIEEALQAARAFLAKNPNLPMPFVINPLE